MVQASCLEDRQWLPFSHLHQGERQWFGSLCCDLPGMFSHHGLSSLMSPHTCGDQDNGLVPIVEPEILMDGDHGIEVTVKWTELVVAECYQALRQANVLLEGTLLKPNMVVPGSSFKKSEVSAEQIGHATVTALQRSVPVAVPGITVRAHSLRSPYVTSNSCLIFPS